MRVDGAGRGSWSSRFSLGLQWWLCSAVAKKALLSLLYEPWKAVGMALGFGMSVGCWRTGGFHLCVRVTVDRIFEVAGCTNALLLLNSL